MWQAAVALATGKNDARDKLRVACEIVSKLRLSELSSEQQEKLTTISLGEEEKAAHTSILKAATVATPRADAKTIGRKIADDMQEASDLIDKKLALNFTIYSDEIEQNGYNFQAHLIETQALPRALDYAERNRDSLAKFDERWGVTIKELKLKEWNWKARAAYVDMTSEYNFIYSYTSRLLHATPASLSTNQKSLEDNEVLMFLRYIAMQFRWIIKHAEMPVT